MTEYDARKDGFDSYHVAIAAKRAKLLQERCPAAKRVVVIGSCELYLGDCAEILPTLDIADAAITDPPYGIGRDGQTKTIGGHGGRKGYEHKGWDKSRPPEIIFSRIIQRSKMQIIWGGNYFADLLPASGKWLVWDKGQRINQSDCELAYTSMDGALRIFELNRVALLTDGTVNPTQKPVELMRWCLDMVSDANTILDPFMGSGTTGIACVNRGKSFIGIELDEEYFNHACARIRKAYAQPDMFVSQPSPKPIQETFL